MYSEEDYLLCSATLPSNSNNNVILSNAFIGHRLHGNAFYMNGLYNGFKKSCHRARIPCFIPYVDRVATSYTLNSKHATYTIEGDNYQQLFYAHSVLNRIFVTEVTVKSNTVLLVNQQGEPSDDLNIISFKTESFEEIGDANFQRADVFAGQIKNPESESAPKLTVYCIRTAFAERVTVGNHVVISAFGYSHEEALKFYKLAIQYHNNGVLLSSHKKSWEYIWNTVNIDVNNPDFAKTVKSSMFFLLSAFPHFALANPELENYPFQFFGVSPGSLGNGGNNQDYWGHVFWDQDLWMLPGIMLLFPNLVRQSILYRVAMLPGAKTKARQNGYMGAMYPWESGRTGVDVCPGEIYSKYQQHITACVVFAIRQYVYVTGSWDILVSNGAWDVVKETADYWVSRVQWDGENFVINNVMDPDEYHYNVNNSCFTNAAARLNILFAIEASLKLGKKHDPRWVAVSHEKGGIKIPFDKNLRYHPEYDGYTPGTLIKQASVVLLGYPLGVKMDDDVRRNDIIQYEKCTDKGPGMTYSMYSIGMLELGKRDEAEKLFKVQFRHIRPPFRIWNEYPNAVGCTNFLTAVGGFLQSLLYGYLGIRVLDDCLMINPNLIPDSTHSRFTGITYRSERFNVDVFDDNFVICRTTGNAFELWYIEMGSDKWPLITDKVLNLPYGLYSIRRG